MRRDLLHLFPLISILLLFSSLSYGQGWSGTLAPARATDWTQAGLPGDVPPDSSWTQSGSTITACGSSSSPVSPSTCGITAALTACGTNHYVLLGSGDFYLTGSINVPSNCVLRGGGANVTRLHAVSGGSYNCNGMWGFVCLIGSNTYGVGCNAGTRWPCPAGNITTSGISYSANWTGGYSQGSTSIILDSVTGIVVGVTPILLDQCDIGFSGNTSNYACGAPVSGNAGAITMATVGAGGAGYAVNDTGVIGTIGPYFGATFGSGTATYEVTSVSSGGAVIGFTITGGGYGYTYSDSTPTYASTTATSGGGSGFEVNITDVGSYDAGSIFPCSISMICEDQSPANTSGPARSQEETVIVTNISGSGPYTVTINRAIEHNNWASSQGPHAWWGSSTVTNLGIEDMELDQSAYTGNCGHGGCMNALGVDSATHWWIVGVSSNVANFFHVNAWYTSNGLIRDSYFYETAQKGTQSYGIGCTGFCGGLLFENNIIQGVVDPENVAGTCSGCVFAYNFAVNQDDTSTAFLFSANPMHSGSTDYILEEGNIGAGTDLDSIHGPHFLNTFVRNYFNGYEANEGVMPSQDTTPITLAAFSRYNNVVGNVLGTTGYHTTYKCAPTSATQHYCPGVIGYEALTIYNLGWSHGDQLDYNFTPPTPNDIIAAPSTMLWGNYDTVNDAVQWNTSEVPSNDPNFPNPVPTSQTLSPSFYNGVSSAYPACGTGLPFWKNPTTGTCPPFPSIGPDVTGGDIGICTSGPYNWSRALTSAQCGGGTFTASTNGGYGNSNPAMRCYLNQMGGRPDGTGSSLSFNRASCYTSDSSSAPAPPTGLTAIVN
jgi:hypothetical protein